jgi:hypothetical protein
MMMNGLELVAYSPTEEQIIAASATLLTVTAPFWACSLLFPSGYPYAVGLAVVPVLVLANAFLIARVSRKDALLAKLLPIAFLAKLAAAAIYLFLVEHVMGGGDALAYHQVGSQIASDFLVTRDWASFTVSRAGMGDAGPTLFVCELTGLLYSVTGSSISSGIVVFSIVAFWGQYLAYRAFTLAFPTGDRSRAALLLLLYPSTVFWTATIGKDAIIGFLICLAAYGFARLVRAPGIRAYLYLAIGLLGEYFVRPHIAAILALAFTGAYVFGRNLRGFFGVAVKIVTIPLLAYGSVELFRGAQRFLNAESFSQMVIEADTVTRNTNIGHSAIGTVGGSLFGRMASAPFLLFRPFPWEINNFQAAVACAETLFLLGLLWVFRAQLKAAAQRWRRDPFLLFIFLYVIGFTVIVGSTFFNIGLIARQRVMMLPFALMLLCLYSGESASHRRKPTKAVRARSKPTNISSNVSTQMV